LTDYSVLINSIFGILNSKTFDEETKSLYAENLTSFINHLVQNGQNEPLGFFASLYSSSQFKNAVTFIMENCMSVVMNIVNFVGKIL